jgi:hypothetical protein
MRVPKPELSIVAEQEPTLDMAKDIYADARAKALDSARWARMHVRADRSLPIEMLDRPKRRFALSRGGFTFEVLEHGHRLEEKR